ncbi:universal stress protein [Pseudonocardia acidicola]|uniref:Universal stress protein n=1 Tax=Pseudonocardia acidicola TaxID=2724939 RepID=A0ABX1SBQ7_9PSEU|nr:universal stress protein [Pseudonocardia acidicola]NMH97618.1 universal stress protein [Pseudonocardia acidicola]
MPSVPSVLVGADGSGPALRAVAWAAEEAALHARPLEIVCVSEPTDTAAGILDRARTIARAVADVPVRIRCRAGRPAEVLTELSREAGLLVVGHRGGGGVDRPAHSSVAVTVGRRAACPVLVVRAAAGRPVPDRARPIVVAVDGSPDSRAAVDVAAQIARERGGVLVAVHVWFERPADALRRLCRREHEPAREAARRLLADCLAGTAALHPGLTVHPEVMRGSPTWSLLELSDSAQLLVVGRGGHGRRALGRTTWALLHGGACPVAVVGPRPALPDRLRPVLAGGTRGG